ncbi:MAG: recombinase family protein [Candidatus Syntrophopropionicum ammoniitolerans]
MSFTKIHGLQNANIPIQVASTAPKLASTQVERSLKKPRVASYCRVSTEEEIQLGSLENQIIHYTNLIHSNPNWQYAGVFSDRGKSGTDMSKRTGFNKMISCAMKGEIDIIICKSISRFARNVVDTLEIVRILMEKGVQVIFEKEQLNSQEMGSSLILKILAIFAEEESRSISENIEWSLTRRFASGEICASALLGYDINDKKEWIIIEHEARVVREAYALFLKGNSFTEIARIFIEKGYRKKNGRIDWSGANIKGLLTNERYTGDVISQKTCTIDFRSHKSVANNGLKPQYYIEDHHEGIISKDEFQKVQEILAGKEKSAGSYKRKFTPFSGRVFCSICGGSFHRREYRNRGFWRCANNSKSELLCRAKTISEEKIESLLKEGFEKRYAIDGKTIDMNLIKRLIKELNNAESVREREQNLLRVELEKALIEENRAIIKNLEVEEIRNKRKTIEKEIVDKKPLWEAFDKDGTFRKASLKRLKATNGSLKALNQIMDISFIRAWVIHIKVESPFLFTIRWIDGNETVVGQFRGSEYFDAKQKQPGSKSKSKSYSGSYKSRRVRR